MALPLPLAFDPEKIKAGWKPQLAQRPPRNLVTHPLPTDTSKWTPAELIYFNMHMFPVKISEWTTYICPKREITQKAKDLSPQIPINYRAGEHLTEADHIVEWGDILASFWSSMAVTILDYMAMFLLRMSNPCIEKLIVEPKQNSFPVSIAGVDTWFSLNASVSTRSLTFNVYTVVALAMPMVWPDNDPPDLENADRLRVPGTMLTVALSNMRMFEQDQTIFALHFIGKSLAIYRADFSYEYLCSLEHGRPSQHITIFELGLDETRPEGLRMDEDRIVVFEVLCSIMAMAGEFAQVWAERKVHPSTADHLKWLAKVVEDPDKSK